MAAYVMLAVIAQFALDELFRWVVWILVAGLAVMTLARAKYGEPSDEDSRE